MLQLRPTETFTIVRVLEDTQDSDTYYVRAVIRNSKTGATIDTIDLTDQGSRRFTGEWEVTADVSGEGFYIDITNTVYTDSGYTTEAGDYGEVNATYLVQDRMNANLGGHGGGHEISPKAFREIVNSEIARRKIPKQEKVNLKPLMERLTTLEEMVNDIVIPIPEKVDLSGVLKSIELTKEAINNKHIPIPDKVDLSPVITGGSADNKLLGEEIKKAILALKDEFLNTFKEDRESFANDKKAIVDSRKKQDLTIKMRQILDKVIDEDNNEEVKEEVKKDRGFKKSKRTFLNT